MFARTSVSRSVLLWLPLIVALFFISGAKPLLADSAQTTTTEQSSGSLSSVVERPRWEFGLGGGLFSGFDYPASSDSNERGLVVPFFIYRSPRFRFGDGGVRAVAIERPRIKLDISIGGSLSSSTEGNSARQGMPDLDYLFELGPQLEVRLFDRSLESGARLQGRFTSELRAVVSTDLRGLESRGVVAELGVGVNVRNLAGTGVTLITGLDASFATEELHDYFYQVDQPFVTETRELFDAKAGYLETTLFLGFATSPLPQVRVFVGVLQGFFKGAANEDSPLFEVDEQTRFALGVAWTIKQSDEMVPIVDLGRSE